MGAETGIDGSQWSSYEMRTDSISVTVAAFDGNHRRFETPTKPNDFALMKRSVN
jgi:hypothetical protein